MSHMESVSRPAKLSFFKILRSEWIKLFTLRSTWWILAATVVANIGICLAIAAGDRWTETYVNSNPGAVHGGPTTIEPGSMGLLSSLVAQGCGFIGQLVFIILSILIITNEYSSGMIRSTLTVAPRRGKVLTAKVLVVAFLAIIVFGVSVAASWAGGYAILRDSIGVDLTLTSATSVRILAGFVAEMVLIALLCFGLGALIRSTGGSIGAAIGVVLILPMIVSLIVGIFSRSEAEPTGWRKWLNDGAQFLPTTAGGLVTQETIPDTSILGPWEGLGVLGGWALLSLIIAYIVTARRDV